MKILKQIVKESELLKFLIGFLIFIVIIISMLEGIKWYSNRQKTAFNEGYLEACKDFYEGKIKYDLIENSDGTRVWVKINEKENLK